MSSRMNGRADEVNFDGLVGPTHNYGGLSRGNLASMTHRGDASNPRAAALQGISKMRALMKLGLKQGVLPPHDRVHIPTLRKFGFRGTDRQVLERAWKSDRALVMNCASASAMWAANAATVSPSADSSVSSMADAMAQTTSETGDSRVHFTPANLTSMFHRSIEPEFTGRCLKQIFSDPESFAHHRPLPNGGRMGDEGAANHGRLAVEHGQPGVELFVYGHSAFETIDGRRFVSRQALESSKQIMRRHGLSETATVFIRQSQSAIDAGAFHNDVVSVTNGTTFLFHEKAFAEKEVALRAIENACQSLGFEPNFVEVLDRQVSLDAAICGYLFNSQLVTLPGKDNGKMALILPSDVEENDSARQWVEEAIAGDGPIAEAHYLDLKQSMRNGGGPACLRLRVVLNETQQRSLGCRLLDDALCDSLEAWVNRNYRDTLIPEDLGDPKLLDENRRALDELSRLLALPGLYEFQR